MLNSITDNPVQGDERNFVHVRHHDQENSTYNDFLRAEPGDTLVVFVCVANDCTDSFADSPAATMHGLTAQLVNSQSGTDLSFGIELQAKNAPAVWDGATVVTRSPARLSPIPGTATMHTADATFPLDDGDFAKGSTMTLGQQRADGEYPVGHAPNGMERGAGFITFELNVDAL